MDRLKGKVAIVTGAAAAERDGLKGIGGATAWLFAREGAKVVIGDIDDERGEKAARQICETHGDALYVHLDVRYEADWKSAVQATISRFGRLDILANCAGNTGGGDTAEHTSIDEWNLKLAIHAKGAFLGVKHVIPEMRKVGGGSIINMSSMHGIVAIKPPDGGFYVSGAGGTAYQSVKGAIRSFTKTAALQGAKDNIRVNSIHPGNTNTPQGAKILSDPEFAKRKLRESETPMARFAEADEIAYPILYLASDESSYVTGAELVVDGGVIAQ